MAGETPSPSTAQQMCPICRSTNITPKYVATDRNWSTTRATFVIAECAECGVMQTTPQPPPSEIAGYYPKQYYPNRGVTEEYYQRYIRPYQLEKIARVQRFKREGSLLDVGCGAGFFVREAAASGFRAEGIEFSEEPASFGRTQWNLAITTGEFRDASYRPSSFDVITLWQVLEHLYEPVGVLTKIHDLLTADGLVVIAVPDPESFQARVFRGRWYHLEVPRHLYHYPPRSLVKLMERSGFEVLEVDHRCREHNGAGYLGSLLRLGSPGEPLVKKAFRKLVAVHLAEGAARLEELFGSGGIYTLVARKR